MSRLITAGTVAYSEDFQETHVSVAYTHTVERSSYVEAIEYILAPAQTDEAQWDSLFASSQDLLAEMADKALAEHRAGLTTPIDPDKL